MLKGIKLRFHRENVERVEFTVSRELIKAVACERRLQSLEVRNKKVEIQTSPLEFLAVRCLYSLERWVDR